VSDPAASSGIRSLADDLRRRTDDQLQGLLLERPDLARPAPSDLTALAARSTTRASTQRAVDGLDRAALDVLTVCVALDVPLTLGPVADGMGAEGSDRRIVADLMERLWRLGLLWGDEPRQVSRTVAEILGPYPAGLGPSRAQLRLPALPPSAGGEEEGMPGAAAVVLDSLTWGPPIAVTEVGTRAHEAAQWLAEHGWCALDGDRLILPREVALERRGGRVLRAASLVPPRPTGTERSPDVIDRTGAGSASECLALLEELLSAWSARPPRVLKAGGLAVRDLQAIARALEVEPSRAAFLVEVAHAAGLVGEDDQDEPQWAPTADYDEWLDLPGGSRWSQLVTAWWESTRDAALIGTHRDGKPVAALSSGVHRPWVRGLRQEILAIVATAGPGQAVGQDAVLEVLAWQRPRRLPGDAADVVRAVLDEAGTLGLVALGAVTSAARILVGRTEARGLDPVRAEDLGAELARAVETHLPAPVEHVLLQADLTAVVPGPMTGSLAHFLRLAADVESRGGASVHRFSEASIRRVLDAGWSVEETLSALADASATQVPQPLDYLVRDAARRHGRVRVTGARGVLVVDDPGTLAAMLADRSLGALQLRRVAPTVALSAVAPDLMLDLLRASGHPAVLETASGAIALRQAKVRRARPVVAGRPVVHSVDVDAASGIVAQMRSGEMATERTRAAGGPALLPTGDPTASLVALRDASVDGRPVWVGYSDAGGAVRRFLFHPESVEHGAVHGTADGVRRTLSIHRVTGVAAE